MGAQTRYFQGKLWKQGKTTIDGEKYYLEFKDQIDEELGLKVDSKKKKEA